MDMRITPLQIKIMPESNPRKPTMLVGRLTVSVARRTAWRRRCPSTGRTCRTSRRPPGPRPAAEVVGCMIYMYVYIYIYTTCVSLSLSLYIYIYIHTHTTQRFLQGLRGLRSRWTGGDRDMLRVSINKTYIYIYIYTHTYIYI